MILIRIDEVGGRTKLFAGQLLAVPAANLVLFRVLQPVLLELKGGPFGVTQRAVIVAHILASHRHGGQHQTDHREGATSANQDESKSIVARLLGAVRCLQRRRGQRLQPVRRLVGSHRARRRRRRRLRRLIRRRRAGAASATFVGRGRSCTCAARQARLLERFHDGVRANQLVGILCADEVSPPWIERVVLDAPWWRRRQELVLRKILLIHDAN